MLADPATAAAGATALHWAGWLEMVPALACIGTAVACSRSCAASTRRPALGFVGSRTLEAAIIVMGVLAMLSVTVVDPQRRRWWACNDWAFSLGRARCRR